MVVLSIFCSSCGNQVVRMVDENCPPRWLRCVCGEKYSLTVDPEPQREFFMADDLDEADVLSEEAEV